MDDARISVAFVESIRTVPKTIWVAWLWLKKMLPPKIFWFFPPHGDISNLGCVLPPGLVAV